MDSNEDLDDILNFATNKLNVKNAFDINAEFIKDIPKMLEGDKHEESWTRTSEVIAVGSKIYGLRVDNVYKSTQNLLNGFHRTAAESNNNDEDEENNGQPENRK